MLDRSAPACRGSGRRQISLALTALASLTTIAAAQGVPDSPLPYGEVAPALALNSLDHGTRSLAALHGKVVLVHFFATWCEPCREEMAALRRLSARMAARPFAILAVDVGEPETRVRRFFAQEPAPFPILMDENRAAMKGWKVEFFPTSYLLDAGHRLRLYAAGPVDWDAPEAIASLESLISGTEPPAASPLPSLPDDSGSNQQ